eukprot:TRINITY_DN31400_c0_g1_i1.p1 TRINITY_DN31400_c0_g1~~TRINITY_DN31400_c0_g1_i1.p1  ORF type:complete len:675 (-),score=135.41 TRINITY_DN31400_c0_g1_i1:224-2038(-)
MSTIQSSKQPGVAAHYSKDSEDAPQRDAGKGGKLGSSGGRALGDLECISASFAAASERNNSFVGMEKTLEPVFASTPQSTKQDMATSPTPPAPRACLAINVSFDAEVLANRFEQAAQDCAFDRARLLEAGAATDQRKPDGATQAITAPSVSNEDAILCSEVSSSGGPGDVAACSGEAAGAGAGTAELTTGMLPTVLARVASPVRRRLGPVAPPPPEAVPSQAALPAAQIGPASHGSAARAVLVHQSSRNRDEKGCVQPEAPRVQQGGNLDSTVEKEGPFDIGSGDMPQLLAIVQATCASLAGKLKSQLVDGKDEQQGRLQQRRHMQMRRCRRLSGNLPPTDCDADGAAGPATNFDASFEVASPDPATLRGAAATGIAPANALAAARAARELLGEVEMAFLSSGAQAAAVDASRKLVDTSTAISQRGDVDSAVSPGHLPQDSPEPRPTKLTQWFNVGTPTRRSSEVIGFSTGNAKTGVALCRGQGNDVVRDTSFFSWASAAANGRRSCDTSVAAVASVDLPCKQPSRRHSWPRCVASGDDASKGHDDNSNDALINSYTGDTWCSDDFHLLSPVTLAAPGGAPFGALGEWAQGIWQIAEPASGDVV